MWSYSIQWALISLLTVPLVSPKALDLFKSGHVDDDVPGQELDLAFIMDCTGSMGSYIETARRHIKEIVDEIVSSSNSDVRVALVEYRDHPPQDSSFVTKTYNFTDSVFLVKLWLNAARASGGGDGPEAVGEGLYQATKLSWRPKATKVAVLISDAPPHGLVPSEDSSFKNGDPNGHDPMHIVRNMAQMGITMYVIGCEPAIVPYKDFFMALEYLTGGQYVPLSKPELLVDVVTGGAKEELSIQKFEELVKAAIEKANATGKEIDKDKIAQTVYNQLVNSGATSAHLLLNNATLEQATDNAKEIAKSSSMSEARLHFHKGTLPAYHFAGTFAPLATYSPLLSFPPGSTTAYPGMTFLPGLMPTLSPYKPFPSALPSTPAYYLTPAPGYTYPPDAVPTAYPGMTYAPRPSPASTSTDKISVGHSGVSLDQVDRLVVKVLG